MPHTVTAVHSVSFIVLFVLFLPFFVFLFPVFLSPYLGVFLSFPEDFFTWLQLPLIVSIEIS